MSRETGKLRPPAAKRQTRTARKGEQTLIEKQAHDLQFQADTLRTSSTHHAPLLSSQEKVDIESSIRNLEREAQSLVVPQDIQSKQLESVEEHSEHSSSDIEEEEDITSEEEDITSRIGSSTGTVPYKNTSSPPSSRSPQDLSQLTPPLINPQFNFNPPPAITANPIDPLTMMKAMFEQQAMLNRQQQEAMLEQQAKVNRQQQEAMLAQQTEVNRQHAENNQQLQLLLATSLDRQLDQQDKQMKHHTSLGERQAIADVRTSIKMMRDGMNIVQYMDHFETEVGDAHIPLPKWKHILVSKLSVKAEKICAHLINSDTTYQDLKKHLLDNIGPSADELCNIMHGAISSEFSEKSEAHKLQQAKYITERYFLGTKVDNTIIEYVAVRLFKFHCHRRFAHVIKLSKLHSFAELLEMAASFDSQLDYERASKPSHSQNKQPHRRVSCDFCKKTGHVEADCYKKQGLNKQSFQHKQQKPQSDNQQTSDTKYYKSNKETGIKKRPATVSWGHTVDAVKSVKGIVNGYKADIILDTGAQITVVPGKYIYEDNLTGHTIDILGINGSPKPYQTATIPISINDTQVEETVAVASESQLNSKVLLATPLSENTTSSLIDSYLAKNGKQRVTTRQQTSSSPRKSYTEQLNTSYNDDDRSSDLSYCPSSDSDDSSEETISDDPCAPIDKYPITSILPSSPLLPQNQTQSSPEPYSSNPTIENYNPSLTPEPYSSNSTNENSNSILTPEPYSSNSNPENNNASSTPEPYSSNHTLEHNNQSSIPEPYSSTQTNRSHDQTSTPEPNSSTLNNNTLETAPYSPATKSSKRATQDKTNEGLPELPIVPQGTNTQVLKQQTTADPTLKVIRGLAHHHKNGYGWENGLLVHSHMDHTTGERKRLVIPKPKRQELIKLAHNKSGHFSLTKTKAILNHRFTWPGMSNDVRDYILSCETCKMHNKHTHKPAPYYTRPVISEPFEEIALDIIGPLPRSRQGYRYALTAICMASRWPEVYPLKDTKAESIVDGLVHFIARNGIPSKVLTDQGSQFTSEVMAQTCQLLGTTHITTVPYRPQGNGILERFHGTLKPLLAKIASKKLDWAQFIPIALSAIRAIPCRSTGFSPAEIVFGRNTRNILDIVYEGWMNPLYSKVDITTWVQQLQEKLEIIRDAATLNNQTARLKQNTHSSHSRSTRSYMPGDMVFTRIPGCRANLQASWEGPFKVVKCIPPLNYEIQDADNTWSRVTHLNNLKTYKPLPKPQPLQVQAACLVAEENSEMTAVVNKGPSLVGGPCVGYSQGEMDQLLQEHAEVFSSTPGRAQVDPFSIRLEQDALPSSRPPYQVPIHLREEVNTQIDQLLQNNIIESSNSTDWCSPIVPVRKPDKSIRLCVDYRELNKVTPLDRHMIPTLPEILDRVGHAQCLSKIDLTSGFHQIAVEPNSRNYTTFLSPKGKFRFVRMPFGLKNAPSHFQRTMETVLAPVADCAAIYIDDIVIYSSTWQQHLSHIDRVLACLKDAGLTIKRKKCEFGKTKLQYLGHVIGSGQMAVPEHRVMALAKYKRPVTKRTLRSFLGCMSYYRRFIPKYADLSAHLTPSTSVSAPKVVAWTVDMDKAFNSLKVSLCDHVSLNIPSITDEFTLHTDASGFGIGACLHVVREQQELPVAFFSRQLQDAEKRYSITELETLAIVAAVKYFQFYIYGTSIDIVTDHRACTALLTSPVLNARLKRMALFLQDKDISILYQPGEKSANADGLSRQFDDSNFKDDSNSSTPVPLPQVEAAGGCGSSRAPRRTPPNTPLQSTTPFRENNRQ